MARWWYSLVARLLVDDWLLADNWLLLADDWRTQRLADATTVTRTTCRRCFLKLLLAAIREPCPIARERMTNGSPCY